ncbi:MAG: hypothetical protein HZY76_03100 [Anaerolineae bacterium]|nr:MAG: hypothetical protein HZY76_03100 [Anaerolineae bacterium]
MIMNLSTRSRLGSGIPGIVLLTCVLLVVVTRASANPNSTITVISPNGGEAWAGGQVRPVTWATSGGPLSATPLR